MHSNANSNVLLKTATTSILKLVQKKAEKTLLGLLKFEQKIAILKI